MPSVAFARAMAVRVTGGPHAVRHDARCPRCAGRRSAGAATPTTTTASTHAPHGPGRRARGLARVPVPLHVLREGQLPRRVPEAPARRDPRRARRRSSPQGVDVRLLHRRDLPPRRARCSRRSRGATSQFGVQMRIDNWTSEMLDLLGRAGCVSIEAGVESITPEGRALLAKRCKLSTDELAERPGPRQGSACRSCRPTCSSAKTDDPDGGRGVARAAAGATACGPTSRCRFSRIPGSPDYTRRWGAPDDQAWERAHEHYLAQFDASATSRRGGRCRCAELEGARSDDEPSRRVLMTADTVGGVWTYALELAAGAGARGVRVDARDDGRAAASPRSARRRARIPGWSCARERLQARVDGRPVGRRRARGPAGCSSSRRGCARTSCTSTATRTRRCRSARASWWSAHSCVLSWWRAVHGDDRSGRRATATGARSRAGWPARPRSSRRRAAMLRRAGRPLRRR